MLSLPSKAGAKAKAKERAEGGLLLVAPHPLSAKPEPAFAELPPHERILSSFDQWNALGDVYVSTVVKEGLLLDWIEGFESFRPSLTFAPMWCSFYPRHTPENVLLLTNGCVKALLKRFKKLMFCPVLPFLLSPRPDHRTCDSSPNCVM